ncbi:LysR family transcriptional regulator [Nocardioides marinus]|nr:LysR family transcriptional regulator [Nocardioides marinus]
MNDLRALRVFSEICRLGSFSKAAVALGMAQPSISRIVRELEENVGSPLFLRTGRGVVPSEVGEVAFERAERLLLEADQMMVDLRNASDNPSGKVIVGLLPSVAQHVAADLTKHVANHAPEIFLSFRVGSSDQVDRWVSEGRVDIGLLGFYKGSDEGGGTVLFRSELLLIGSARHRCLPEVVNMQQLSEYPLVIAPEPNGLRLLLRDAARSVGSTLNVVVEAEAIELQKTIIQECLYFSVVARTAVEDELRSGIFHSARIESPQLLRSVVLTTTQQRPTSRAARLVTDVLIEKFRRSR